MDRTVYRIGPKAFFKFPYSKSLNITLKTTCAGHVHWDWTARAWTVPVATLNRDPRLRKAISRFIIDYGFELDGQMKQLLGISPARAKKGTASLASGFRIGPGHLTADLLPGSSWGSNLRGILSKADWDRLRIPVCEHAGWRCEVCAALTRMPDGRRRRPDCHELWTFTHRAGRPVQRLDGLMALCPGCHRVQNVGRAEANGQRSLIVGQLRRVNSWTKAQAEGEIARAKRVYEQRRLVEWDLDLSVLSEFITIKGHPTLYIPASERRRLGNSYHG